jgi:hypothetical protein
MKECRGADVGLLIADELRLHTRKVRPDWPSEQDRQHDLEVHIRVGAALRSVHVARLRGVRVPVISPEDLVVTKILAGRPKDLEDVRGVLRQTGAGFDLERVRSLLALLEAALDRSDLRTLFEEQAGKTKS